MTDISDAASGTPLDDAVQMINERCARVDQRNDQNWLQAAHEIGRLVIDRFFDGLADNFRNRDPNKHQSFRQLQEHADLEVKRARLYGLIRVHLQAEVLGDETTNRLGFSRSRALLRIEDTNLKCQLAQEAIQDGWSYKQLGEAIAHRCGRARTGRKPIPAAQRALNRASRQLATIEDHEWSSLGGTTCRNAIARAAQRLGILAAPAVLNASPPSATSCAFPANNSGQPKPPDFIPPPFWNELQFAARSGHTMLVGPKGTGKTHAVRTLATQAGVELVLVQGHADMTVEELRASGPRSPWPR